MAPEAVKSKIEMPARLVPGETFPPGSQTTSFPMVLTGPSLCAPWQRGFGALFFTYKAPALLDQGPTLMTSFNLYHLLTGPVSKYSHVGG